MDRTIPPGIPGGEDAGADVGVVGPDSKGRNSTTVRVKGSQDSTHKVASKAKVAPEDRLGDTGAGREAGPGDRVGRSSVGRAP